MPRQPAQIETRRQPDGSFRWTVYDKHSRAVGAGEAASRHAAIADAKSYCAEIRAVWS